MLFVGGGLRVALVTIHRSLRSVPDAITRGRGAARRAPGPPRAAAASARAARRIALCGLNPHAGEGGLFGREEIEVLAPAVARAARAKGIDVSGPFPADSLFVRASRGEFDAVVAQYHDQGLIPVKLAAFGHAVNVTLGLPFVRTSVDHGTGFDIVEKGIADEGSLLAAMDLAADARRRRRRLALAPVAARPGAVSRSMSLRLIDSRLSWDFLPRARPISSFTRPVLEVGLQGHDREPLLRGLAAELQDLALVQQQLAVAALGVVLDVAVAVGADAAAHQAQLAAAELHEGVAEVEPALADRLHLRAAQDDAGLGPLEDLVVEEGLAVGGDDLVAARRRRSAMARPSVEREDGLDVRRAALEGAGRVGEGQAARDHAAPASPGSRCLGGREVAHAGLEVPRGRR